MTNLIKKIGKRFHSTGIFQFVVFRPFAILGWKLYNRCLGSKPLTTKYNFSLYTLPNDETIRLLLILDGVFEMGTSELFKKIISPGKTFVDVGANIGYFSVMAAELGAKVYAFEPIPDFFDILYKNIKLNKCNNIIASNIAIGSQTGELDIYIDDKNPGGTSFIKREKSLNFTKQKVQVKRLDDVLNKKVDILKIDVEGFEYEVLLGAKNILSQDSLEVIIEFAPEHDEIGILDKKELPQKIIDKLLEYGFRIDVISEENGSLTNITSYENFLERYGYGGLYNLYAYKGL